MCFATAMMARIWCSTMTMVRPRLESLPTRATAWSTSARVRPAMASSRSSSRGCVASARAISRRRWSMVVRSRAAVLSREDRPTKSMASRAFSRAASGLRSRRKAPVITLASTVMPPKGLATWKVRARPCAQTSCGRRPTSSRPKADTEPASGLWKPMMRLNAVVLPAPFGPISARISFSRTVKLTSCTARRPPKRLHRSLTTRASATASAPCRLAPALIDLGDVAHDAGRLPQDHRHQDQAVDGQLHAADRIAEPTLQQGRGRLQEHSADQRAPQRADAADDGDQRGLDRDAEVERRLRVDEVDVLRVERAGQRGEERRDHVDIALDARHVDADRFGGVLVLAQGDEVIADAGALDPGGDRQCCGEQAEH